MTITRRLRAGWVVVGLAWLTVWASAAHAEPVCAQVKIEIKQELTLERQGFDAMMRINNGLDTLAIKDVLVTVNFQDENGTSARATSDPADVGAAFFIRVDSMQNIADVSGSGVVAPGSTAEIHWLIIPSPGAAADRPTGKLFFVGANLTYTLGGEVESVDVTPDFITVKPLPQLTLDYFLTRDVVGDDPFTTAIEPIEPYTLGVRVKNNGIAAAQNLKIDSAQPRIIENEQGLLIGFEIIGSTLDDQPVAPVLLMDFGQIDGNTSRIGRWLMTTTLSGEFVDFTATFSHADELGGAVTSILDVVTTHSLVHDVRVDLPGRDTVRDFLAKDGDVYRVYESGGVDTVVADHSAAATLTLIANGTDYADYRLIFPAGPGFSYVRLPDPQGGRYVVRSAVRSDGKRLSLDNAWVAKTRNRNTNPPSWDYHVDLFDANTTGSYVIRLGAPLLGAQPPVMQFIPDRVSYEGGPIGFLVEATDPNGQIPQLSASPLPAGATLVDKGDGTAFFDWSPKLGQAGSYILTFKASDGILQATQSVRITINPDHDRDGDGMDDAWEMLYFATLARDGNGDFDGDGVTDLQEFLDGTDPTRSPGPGQPIAVSPLDEQELITQAPTLVVENGQHSSNVSVTYEYEVYTDASLADLVTSAVGVTEDASGATTWTVTPELADNSHYYWRARAYDGVVYSEWVAGSLFVNTANDAPGPVAVSYPMDGSLVDSFTPTLQVTNSTDLDGDALVYHFQVYADIGLRDLVAEAVDLAPGSEGTTSWTVSTPLTENARYYWQVVVTDEHGAETFGNVASFLVSTVNDAPATPAIVSPLPGDEVAALTADLSVTSVLDPEGFAVRYLFQLDTVNTFDSPDKQVSGPLSARIGKVVWPVVGLMDNTHYYWRAKASDGEQESAWVTGRFFANTVNDAPSVPVAISPDAAGWVGSLEPTLQLAPVSDLDGDALRYQFEVYQLDRKGVVVALLSSGETDVPYWQVAPSLPTYGWYAWRAQAVDEHGAESGWMNMARFFADSDNVNDPPTLRFSRHWEIERKHSAAPRLKIRWRDSDPDSNADIALYYDRDNKGIDGTLIVAGLKEDPDGKQDRYLWDLAGLRAGVYYVYGVIDDGNTSVVVNGPNPILVGDGGGQPYLEFLSPKSDRHVPIPDGKKSPKLHLLWKAYDADSNARIDLYYTTDPASGVGTVIVEGLYEDGKKKKAKTKNGYKWDISQLTEGRYYIYAIISDEKQSVRVFAPGVLEVVKPKPYRGPGKDKIKVK